MPCSSKKMGQSTDELNQRCYVATCILVTELGVRDVPAGKDLSIYIHNQLPQRSQIRKTHLDRLTFLSRRRSTKMQDHAIEYPHPIPWLHG
jgi:hypothetical protein